MHRTAHSYFHRFFDDMVGLGTIITVALALFVLAAPLLLLTHPLWGTDAFVWTAVTVAALALWRRKRGRPLPAAFQRPTAAGYGRAVLIGFGFWAVIIVGFLIYAGIWWLLH